MNAQKVAAQFVAFTFFLNQEWPERVLLDDAGRFARRHWQDFLPYANEDLAGFLTKTPETVSRGVRPAKRQLALVSN